MRKCKSYEPAQAPAHDCAEHRIIDQHHAETTGNTASVLRSLLLFDHVILHSVRFCEVPTFVTDLGIDATIALLKAKTLTLFPDFVIFGMPSTDTQGAPPLNHFTISTMSDSR